MPLLLLGSPTTTGWRRAVELTGLPIFNQDDRDWLITDLDGWAASAKPDAVLVGNGGGPGSVAAGAWLPQEQPLTVSGVVFTDWASQASVRAGLLAALPTGVEAPFIVQESADEPALVAYVRRYDRADFIRRPDRIQFVLPLIMADPYKYGAIEVSGTVGVFTAEDWYDTYFLVSGSIYAETYSGSGAAWYLPFTQAVSSSIYPLSLTLASDGTVSSRRLTATITGPLTAGDWWLEQENTGARQWVNVNIAAGQQLVIDEFAHTADLAGSDVTHALYGDWLTLEPGDNTYRLTSGTDNPTAYAILSGLAAYE